MTDIHPHWHTTEDQDESPDTVEHTKETTHIPIAGPAVSRRPAAFLGIALVLGLGFVFVGEVSYLRGELAPEPVVIRITDNGLDPQSAKVQPNQDIQWVNEQSDMPHILTSDTIEIHEGFLYTSHILPGSDYSATLSPTMEPGTYTYISLTSPDIAGEIVVPDEETIPKDPPPLNPDPPPPETPPTFTKEDVEKLLGEIPNSPPPPVPTSIDPLPPPPPPVSQAPLIPRNPYTVDGTVPVAPPLPANVINPSASIKRPPAPPAPLPFHQPSTGPGLWLISLLSVVGLFFLTRKYFKQHS